MKTTVEGRAELRHRNWIDDGVYRSEAEDLLDDLDEALAQVKRLGEMAQQARILFGRHNLTAEQGELHDKIDTLLRNMVRATLAADGEGGK